MTVTLLFSSCLKDKFNILNTDNSTPVIEFRAPSASDPASPDGSLYIIYPVAMDVSPSIERTFEVQLTGPDVAPQDIVVNIGSNSAAVAEFNADKQAGNPAFAAYDLLEPTSFTINTPTVTIPKGQRTAEVKVTFRTDQFSFTKKYALPITITSTNYATISKSFGTILLNAIAKNRLDGRYTINVNTFVDAANAAFGALTPMTNMSLITTGANTAALYDGRYAANAYGHPFSNAGTTSYYGSWSPVFHVNFTTGAVTAVTNYYGQPSGNGRSARLDPTGVNHFDVATRTLEVSYFLVENGADRTRLVETWTYTSARP